MADTTSSFLLTEWDIALIRVMRATVLLPTMSAQTRRNAMLVVWRVLAEKHGFDPDTVKDHPDINIIITAVAHDYTGGGGGEA